MNPGRPPAPTSLSARFTFRDRIWVLLGVLVILSSLFTYVAIRPGSVLAVGDATKLVVTSIPIGSHTADDSFGVTVEIQDAGSNRVAGATDTITLDISGGAATPTTDGSFSISAVDGTATFSGLAIRSAGTAYQLTASSGSLVTDHTDTFNVTSGNPTDLFFTTNPVSTYTADDTFPVVVEAHDAYGNLATDDVVSVDLTLTNPNGASLAGTRPIDTIGGIATFTGLAVHKVGTGYGLDASATALTGDSSSPFDITPGKLDSFDVSTSPATKVAGTEFDFSATAKDHWGNLKTDYTGSATVTGNLSTSPGLTNSGVDDQHPIYTSFAAGSWSSARTTKVKGFVAETGKTVSVSVTGSVTYSGLATGSSGATVDVNPADAADIKFSVASNDTANPFSFGPISTKVNSHIYSACAPPAGPQLDPCALTTGTSPNRSTAVRTLVRDAFGNPILPQTVTITRLGSPSPTPTPPITVGASTSNSSGVADFADTLSIPTVGNYVLTATVTSGPTHPATTASIAIVNDLKACDTNTCENNTSNGAPNLQKAYAKITATGTITDFFDESNTNVRLTTQFVPGSEVDNKCVSNKTIGDATDLRVAGPGVLATGPATRMVLVLPKDTLKAYGITARGTSTFNLCLGALYIGAGSPPTQGWHQKTAKKGPLPPTSPVSEGGEFRYWGTPADCTDSRVNRSYDPCIGLRTKQVADVATYLGMTSSATMALLGIKDADLVIILEKPFPWDGKVGGN